LRWESITASDRGKVRPNNEDAFLECSAEGLFAVADGMGGHAAGEVASGIAIESLREQICEAGSPGEPSEPLIRSYVLANREIRRRGRAEPDKRGMGTTMTAVLVQPDGTHGVIAHVGDSRAYRYRASRLEQLTTDHTWVQERIDAGVLSVANARNHPYSSILTRVLGTDEAVVPDLIDIDIMPSDLLLICSDGLSGLVEDEAMASILAGEGELTGKADALIAAAWEGGAHDNITLVLVHFFDSP
jgi:PPM family protein phosphatase